MSWVVVAAVRPDRKKEGKTHTDMHTHVALPGGDTFILLFSLITPPHFP